MRALFSPDTVDWFERNVGQPTQAQALGWPAIASGAHALISAPTGTGKTLAAFLVFVDRLHALKRAGQLEDKLYVLYISPLKALASDIRENLKRPIEGIPCPEVRTAVRTGDTDASERRQMIKHPPHILITTPESLYLLLTSKSGRGMLGTTQCVIVDELHALIDTKRGAHLQLSLSRLDALTGKSVQRIALSATIRPPQVAAKFLAHDAEVAVVAPDMEKSRDIEVRSVVPDMRVLPERTIWPELARAVYEQCQGARTVIAFVEGRAQAEKLAHAVNAIAGEGFSRTHHGCVSKQQRHEAEQALRSGTLRLLCATSSMELGIDVGEVDRVVQIGCPLTVSGALQRLGRAGHNPGRTSVMRIFPRMISEVVTCGMTATAALNGAIEPARPPENCLDIVAQHLVSMAAEGTYTVDALLDILHTAHSFKDVTRTDVDGVLAMLAGDYEHERDHPVRPRLIYDRIHGTVSGDAYTRMLALSSGGTIPDRGWFPVTLEDGTRLGELDEEYVFEARIGDKFLLGAFAWRMLEIRKDRVVVAPASVEGAQVPFWKGDGRGRDYEVALTFGASMRALNRAHARGRLHAELRALNMDEHAALNAARHVARQIELTGCLPDDRTVVVEHFFDEAGEHQMMVHSIFGRRVNMALELLVRRAAEQATGMDVKSYSDDDGFLLYVMGDRPLPDGLLNGIDQARAADAVRAMLPATPLFTMSFRYNAARALMMGVRRGGRVPLWVQRLRGAEALADAAEYASHPLVRETMRECERDYLDLHALNQVLEGIRSGGIRIRELHSPAPSPMALPLRRQVEAVLMYEYSPIPSAAVRASDAALNAMDAIAPDQAALERASKQAVAPRDEERLHSLMMAEGDLLADEIDAPVSFLEALLARGRAAYVEPGLWIAAEHAQVYAAALEQGDEAALLRIVRRCLRFRGAQSVGTLVERYQIDEAVAARVLNALEHDGVALRVDDVWYHHEVYDRALRETISERRRRANTQPPERFAQMLAERASQLPGNPAAQLSGAMEQLLGQPFAMEAWEGYLLPARVDHYKPRLLDELLSRGEVCWRVSGDGRLLSFHRTADIDWDWTPDASGLTGDERTVLTALTRRGASFAHALSALIGGRSAFDVLMSLTEKGLVRADRFAPIRLWMEQKDAKTPKRRARMRVAAQDAGRWELMRPLREEPMEQAIERAFDAYGLLCRETYGGQWREVLELLRLWEYTGRVRRGYFVRGLSGAQFLRADEYERAVSAMASERPDVIWLNAADPMQAWGRYLTHVPERSFMLVAGTVVALSAGRPVMVFERGGEALRAFDEERMDAALDAFVDQFALGRVYPNLNRITVKRCPDAVKGALERAGFVREMMDYVLWRDAVRV